MSKYLKRAGFAGVVLSTLAAASMAEAGQSVVAHEAQSVVMPLGDKARALTYWVSQPDGWHVVTTVNNVSDDSTAVDANIVRVSSVLLPGQSQSISVPVAVGEAQPVLNIRRVADTIEIEPGPAVAY